MHKLAQWGRGQAVAPQGEGKWFGRITIRKVGETTGCMIVQPESFEELLQLATERLALIKPAVALFAATGDEIVDYDVIMPGDIVYVSSGEQFREPTEQRRPSTAAGGGADARRASALRRMSLQQVQHEMAQVQQGIRHAQQERPQHAQLVENGRPPCRRTAPHPPAGCLHGLRLLLRPPEYHLIILRSLAVTLAARLGPPPKLSFLRVRRCQAAARRGAKAAARRARLSALAR